MNVTQIPMIAAHVGDALDCVLVTGPPKTGIRRLYLLDLLVGYSLRSEMTRGWWCQRAVRIRGPFRDQVEEGPHRHPHHREQRYVRMFQVHPAASCIEWWLVSGRRERYTPSWTCTERARCRRRVVSIAWRPLRERLEEETGYRAIWTPAEAADAAKVYGRKPGSVAYRALMTLVDNPLVWSQLRHAA